MVADDGNKQWYLALDLSTQSLKVIVTDQEFKILYEDSINFDADLPEFATENGVHRHEDDRTITSPTLMWVKAVDLILMKMKASGVEFRSIAVMSGTAQQHGSVFWKRSARVTLKHLNEDTTIVDQLQDCFALTDSPVWMDSSTTKQCEKLEEAVGGSEKLAHITGSKAYERFTGNQIKKVFETKKDCYVNCERISLVSSFLASLFLGDYAPIDLSDGSGMNLLNIHTKQWEQQLLSACAPGLANRLGDPVPSCSVLGKISSYMVSKYGFNPACSVVAFTGDNPASLAGMRLADNDVAVSLGTSDTLIFWISEASPSAEGHIFVNPLDKEKFMALLCFKNGSLVREGVCHSYCDASWDKFNEALQRTNAGNNGNVAIYFEEMEILPRAKGVYKWNENDQDVTSFDTNEEEVRAVIEGQFLAKRYHAQKFGFKPGSSSRILATGGASENRAILQVLSDVFNLPVYASQETKNSACMGCVYRCKQALIGEGTQTYIDVIKNTPPHELICEPIKTNVTVYDNLMMRYAKFEQYVINMTR